MCINLLYILKIVFETQIIEISELRWFLKRATRSSNIIDNNDNIIDVYLAHSTLGRSLVRVDRIENVENLAGFFTGFSSHRKSI